MKIADNENNAAVIVCKHVFNRERVASYVDYDESGIQAVCDLSHSGSDIKVISLEELFEMAPELEEVKDLPINHFATRQADATWKYELKEDGA